MVAKNLRGLVFGIVKFATITFPTKYFALFFYSGVTCCKVGNTLIYNSLKNKTNVTKGEFCNIGKDIFSGKRANFGAFCLHNCTSTTCYRKNLWGMIKNCLILFFSASF